jgi:hypothetical protein
MSLFFGHRPSNRRAKLLCLAPTFLVIIAALSFCISISWFIGISSSLEQSTKRDLLTPLSYALQHYDHEDCHGIDANKPKDEDKKKYNFTVAICLVVSDGENYFQEWVDYHLQAMKFENIYVYDNSKFFDLQRWYNNTRNHPIYSRVSIKHRPGPGYIEKEDRYLQSAVYEDCIEQYGKSKDGPHHDYL